jgi:t-SNARE complex subunit (syntaxin)
MLTVLSANQQNVFSHVYRNSGAIERIESTISELNKMFSQLGSLVAEQGEMLDRYLDIRSIVD